MWKPEKVVWNGTELNSFTIKSIYFGATVQIQIYKYHVLQSVKSENLDK